MYCPFAIVHVATTLVVIGVLYAVHVAFPVSFPNCGGERVTRVTTKYFVPLGDSQLIE